MRRIPLLAFYAPFLFSVPVSAGQDVTLESLPQPVRATVERETKGGSITEIELETKKGQASYYEVEFSVGAVKYEVHVALDGRLLLRRLD
jgi:hypothetical protein